MYTTSKEMILAAQRGGYAVPAFNFENMEMVQAIIPVPCKDEIKNMLRASCAALNTPSVLCVVTPHQRRVLPSCVSR